MKEADLFPIVKAELEARGCKVYAEVPWPGGAGSIDVVAVRPRRRFLITVELKRTFSKHLAYQCELNRLITPLSYAAAPTRPSRAFLRRADKLGIGVLRVEPNGVIVEKNPTIGRKRMDWGPTRRTVREFLEANGEVYENKVGGVPTLKGIGPAQECLKRVDQYREDHPRAMWREIYDEVPNHYANHKSMRQSLKQLRDMLRARDAVGLTADS